jgi:phytoene synthase
VDLKIAFEIYSNQIARQGSSFYYSLCYLDQKKRMALIGLYAFRDALLAIDSKKIDQTIALAKLNWWRGEINNLFEGKGSHPVSLLLQASLKQYAFHPQRFHNIVNAVESSLYASESSSIDFLNRTWGEVEVITASILDPESKQDYRSLGMAFALMDNLKRIVQEHKTSALSENLISLQLTEKYTAEAVASLEAEPKKNLLFNRIRLSIHLKTLRKIKSKKHIKISDFYLSPLRLFWISLCISSKYLDSK